MLGVVGQQCCVRLQVASKALKCSNKTVNIGAMTSIIIERHVHAEQNADQHFDTKVKPYRAGLILGQILHCTEQNTSQMPGVWGAMGSVGIEWHINYTKSYADTIGKDQFF